MRVSALRNKVRDFGMKSNESPYPRVIVLSREDYDELAIEVADLVRHKTEYNGNDDTMMFLGIKVVTDTQVLKTKGK